MSSPAIKRQTGDDECKGQKIAFWQSPGNARWTGAGCEESFQLEAFLCGTHSEREGTVYAKIESRLKRGGADWVAFWFYAANTQGLLMQKTGPLAQLQASRGVLPLAIHGNN